MTVRFAIVTPAYQAEATLPEAIDSVLAQTSDDWEYVIVDDGSTDRTGEIAADAAAHDPRIRVISQPNAGCGAARAAGIDATGAPWIVRLDADDALCATYLECMAKSIDERPEFDIHASNGWHLYADGTHGPARPGHDYEREREFGFADMLVRNHVFSPATFSRRIYDIVGIRPDVFCEDLDLWLRALVVADARIAFSPEYLAQYRMSSGQMTADVVRTFDSREAIYRDLLDLQELTDEQRLLVEDAPERLASDRWIYERRTRMVSGGGRIGGERTARTLSRLIHRIGRPLRPLASRILRWFGVGR